MAAKRGNAASRTVKLANWFTRRKHRLYDRFGISHTHRWEITNGRIYVKRGSANPFSIGHYERGHSTK